MAAKKTALPIGADCQNTRGALRRAPVKHQADKPLSTQRRQSGILMHVHSGAPARLEVW